MNKNTKYKGDRLYYLELKSSEGSGLSLDTVYFSLCFMLQDVDKTSECRLVFWTNFLKSLLSKNKLTLPANELTLVQEVLFGFSVYIYLLLLLQARASFIFSLTQPTGFKKTKKNERQRPRIYKSCCYLPRLSLS